MVHGLQHISVCTHFLLCFFLTLLLISLVAAGHNQALKVAPPPFNVASSDPANSPNFADDHDFMAYVDMYLMGHSLEDIMSEAGLVDPCVKADLRMRLNMRLYTMSVVAQNMAEQKVNADKLVAQQAGPMPDLVVGHQQLLVDDLQPGQVQDDMEVPLLQRGPLMVSELPMQADAEDMLADVQRLIGEGKEDLKDICGGAYDGLAVLQRQGISDMERGHTEVEPESTTTPPPYMGHVLPAAAPEVSSGSDRSVATAASLACSLPVSVNTSSRAEERATGSSGAEVWAAFVGNKDVTLTWGGRQVFASAPLTGGAPKGEPSPLLNPYTVAH
jgi:hypothetical protein